jgi:CDP-diacylglycerol--glycerol-3-phosphate 3-phosphatidyltransferase
MPSPTLPPDDLDRVWTVPNLLSAARLVASLALFAVIEAGMAGAAFWLFVVTAATDWVDGWWARTFHQVSRLGRIADPLVDKVLVCGVWILLCGRDGSAIAPWMAVVVVVRELLVTALRAELERSGHDFSAGWSGKAKMLLQCVAAAAELARRMGPAAWGGFDPQGLATIAVWGAVVATVWSGAEYLTRAAAVLGPRRGP